MLCDEFAAGYEESISVCGFDRGVEEEGRWQQWELTEAVDAQLSPACRNGQRHELKHRTRYILLPSASQAQICRAYFERSATPWCGQGQLTAHFRTSTSQAINSLADHLSQDAFQFQNDDERRL